MGFSRNECTQECCINQLEGRVVGGVDRPTVSSGYPAPPYTNVLLLTIRRFVRNRPLLADATLRERLQSALSV